MCEQKRSFHAFLRSIRAFQIPGGNLLVRDEVIKHI